MKRKGTFIGIVILAALLSALFFLFTRGAPKPLTHQGRQIDYWFAQLPITPVPPPGVSFGKARGFVRASGQQYGNTNLLDDSAAAFSKFGTNALPFLLAKLQGFDSAVERQVSKAASRAGMDSLPFRDAELERLQAVTGLIHIGSLTPQARRLLASLSTNSNTNIAQAAAFVLARQAAPGESFDEDSNGNTESHDSP